MKRKVLVLLSTYNGDRFLREQLESLYGQEGVDYHILVRDDGSSDETIAILEKYKKQKAHMTIMRGGQNVGPAWSFFLLIEEAYKKYNDYDYYAFCDQDDIWCPNKLKSAVEQLDVSDNPYRFYSGSYTFINAVGKKIGYKHPPLSDYRKILFRNTCIGFSQVFSKSLLERAMDIFNFLQSEGYDKRKVAFHDRYMSQMAFYLDAFIVADKEPYAYYRQHDKNVTKRKGDTFWQLTKAKYIENTKETPNRFSKNAFVLYRVLNNMIECEKKVFLKKVSTYRKNFFLTLYLAFLYAWLFKDEKRVCLYVFTLILTRHF